MHIENTGLIVKNVSGIPGKSARNPKYCGKGKSFASAKGCVATPSGYPAGVFIPKQKGSCALLWMVRVQLHVIL